MYIKQEEEEPKTVPSKYIGSYTKKPKDTLQGERIAAHQRLNS